MVACTNCEAGRASTLPGATSCIDCGAGSMSSAGSSACTDCEAGRVAALAGLSECTHCSSGSISVRTGSSECAKCPPGKAQGATGQTECVKCIPGTFSATAGTSTCSDCPGNDYSSSGSSVCDLCLRGFYRHGAPTSTPTPSPSVLCKKCPDGTECPDDGGSTQEQLKLSAGYWRIDALSVLIEECPMPTGCSNSTSAFGADGESRRLDNTAYGERYCAEGYNGPLCAVCEPGFFHDTEKNVCEACRSSSDQQAYLLTSVPMLIIYSVVILTIIFLVAKRTCLKSENEDEIFSNVELTDEERERQVKASTTLMLFWRKLMNRCKALWSYLQIVSLRRPVTTASRQKPNIITYRLCMF